MPVTAAEVEEARRLAATLPPDSDTGSGELRDSRPAITAYYITQCRAEGLDEVRVTEAAIRAGGLTADEVRADAKLLHQLGYIEVAAMMRSIAGRRKHDLKPL